MPSSGSLDQRYRDLRAQIDQLPDDQAKLFRQVEALYAQERADQIVLREGARAADDEKQRKRQEEQERLLKEKEEKLKALEESKVDDDKIDASTDVSGMPDCLYKYKIIVKKAQDGEKYTDTKFKANDSSIGPKVLDANLSG